MTSFSMKVEGVDDLRRLMKRYGRKAEGALDDGLKRAAADTVTNARRSIQRGPKTGLTYPPIEGRRGAPHQASAPGQAPATDTGSLVQSIAWQRQHGGYASGTRLKYGAHLEFGTRNMAPRPWLRPAADQAVDDLVPRIVAALKRIRSR